MKVASFKIDFLFKYFVGNEENTNKKPHENEDKNNKI